LGTNKKKITKYVLSSTLLVNTVVGQAAVVFAADEKKPEIMQSTVKELFDKGIFTGDEKGNLNLEGKLTRIQVAAILSRALNLHVDTTVTTSFKDVSADSWGLKYIDALQKLGVMVGSDGKFRPNAVITKEELAVIFVRITQTSIVGKGTNLSVTDANEISGWAKPYVQAAIEAGLITTVNGKFSPKSEVTRQDIAVITDEFIKDSKFEKYKKSINNLLDEGKKISNSDPTV
jgi:hypothetical protein